VLAGCTAQHYRRSADRQVSRILQDRELKTLGYTPEVVATTEAPVKVTNKAYDKIPATPIPPSSPPPIEPSDVVVEYGTLGPTMDWPAGTTGPTAGSLGVESAERAARERLLLGPPAPGPGPARLDLFQAIEYAVQNAPEYRSEMEDLYLSALDVTLERHLFSPRPFLSQALEYEGGQADVNYRSAMTAVTRAGIRQELPYGGEVVASGLVSFLQSLHGNVNEGEDAQLALTASIPLLRGAGMINLEPLIRSERNLVYDVRSFEEFRRQFAVRVASQYLQLLNQQEGIANRRLSFANLLNLTERTQALYIAGRQQYSFVQRALQSQLQTENSLVVATERYQNAVDQFKILLGMPVSQELMIVPIELEVRVPDITEEKAVELALQYRLDYQTARDRAEDAKRGVANARNGLLPELDFTTDTRIGNRNNDAARDINDDTLTYSANLNLDLPIDRLQERNVYRRALISLERAQRNVALTGDRIVSDVQEALRGIRSAKASLEIQRQGIEVAEDRLELENERLKQGTGDSENVVEAQEDLLQAQDEYDQARADLQVAVLQFLRDTGTLRVDPGAGALGQALDRELAAGNVDSKVSARAAADARSVNDPRPRQ
jgi:hypothetical protein